MTTFQVLWMLTFTGGAGLALVARGAYLCVQHRGSIEGVLMFACGMLTCLVTAMLTNGVSP